ncbi:MAG: hypothetical protein ACFFD6_01430 [Candidatus Thorarchaeota archaeon]
MKAGCKVYYLASNSGQGGTPDEIATSILRFDHEYEAFVVHTELACIERAVKRVVFDFTTSVFSMSGQPTTEEDLQTPGSYVRFTENIATCPTIVVALNVGKDFWCILCGNNCGSMKCDELLAMKCARLAFQNLKILKDALMDAVQDNQLTVPSDWRASLLLHHTNPEAIIDEITWRSVE